MLSIANFFARWMLVFRSLKKSAWLVYLVRGVKTFGQRWSLVQHFTLASGVIMFLGMIGIGRWVGEQIKEAVIKEATLTTALYMDSFISPNIQELSRTNTITDEHIQTLNNLFSANDLGKRTVSIKIWNRDHQIVYSNIPSLVGRTFPDTQDQASSWSGLVTGEISNLNEVENVEERLLSTGPLLEVYSPVRRNDDEEIIAVAEFYQKVDTLESEIAAAQREGWAVVGISMLGIYLSLLGFVRWASTRLERQEMELRDRVAQLTDLLAHHKELSGRVRLAAANSTAHNESLLRRISAELHDGPVQEISLALLRLDQAIDQNEACSRLHTHAMCTRNLPVVQNRLQDALKKMRSLAAWFGLPQLERFSLANTVVHAVHAHEQRSGAQVALELQELPEQVSMPIKIAIYRFIQEGLNHMDPRASEEQAVRVVSMSNRMLVEVLGRAGAGESDSGLDGMRERIESLGGVFSVTGDPGQATKVAAYLWSHSYEGNVYG